jgi:hypothetical protein
MSLIGFTASSISFEAQHQTAQNHVCVQKERQTSLVTVVGPLKEIVGAPCFKLTTDSWGHQIHLVSCLFSVY